ncbi:MAG TPA: precorrin-6A synthase (deacetylating) [Acidimicrobiia bacterium]|nr:precorrin-6A synthase (deacetylating) [Acidimicrobiia bacterium]
MRKILVIGIGAGNPDHLTLQAVAAIARADVFFVIDKGAAPELAELRAELLRRHATTRPHRVVPITDAERDRDPSDYREAVAHWHRERAERFATAIAEEVAEDGIGAFLVWGDPSLYDSTVRVLDEVRAAGIADFTCDVIPGISSVGALAASHRVPLHGIGEPLLVTTGRRLAADFGPETPNAVVMLDGQLAFRSIDPTGVEILWAAYLGTSHEIVIRGELAEVADRIVAERAAARARHGWIMDTYLLRRHPADDPSRGTGPGSGLEPETSPPT